jgi:hypothetical protein
MGRIQVVTLLLALALCGCASHTLTEYRIDSSSEDAFHRSWQALAGHLTPDQTAQLNIAVLLIGATKQMAVGTLTSAPGIGPDTIRAEVDGMTFDEIVALSKRSGARITNIQHAHDAT